jgi:hypothetical protein
MMIRVIVGTGVIRKRSRKLFDLQLRRYLRKLFLTPLEKVEIKYGRFTKVQFIGVSGCRQTLDALDVGHTVWSFLWRNRRRFTYESKPSVSLFA